MKRSIILASAMLVLAINSLRAQTNFRITPEIASPGETVKVTYNPDKTVLKDKKTVTADVYQFRNYKWRIDEIKMVKKDSLWVADYLLPADAALVAFKFKSGKVTDIGYGYGWLLSDKNKINIPGAYAGWAFLRNGSVPELFPNYTDNKLMIGDDVVLYWMEMQVKQHPSTKRYITYPWLKVMKKENPQKAAKTAIADISYLNNLPDKNENDLVQIKKIYAEVLDRKDAADSVAKVIAAIDSSAMRAKNQEKLAASRAINMERDYKKTLPMSIDFLNRYPMGYRDHAFDDANFISYAKLYGNVAIIASIEKDTAMFKKYVKVAPFESLANIFYKSVHVPYVSLKTVKAEEAYLFARPVMDRLMDFNATKPEGYWDVYFSNIPDYADILMQLGKDEPALGFATSGQQKYEYENSPLNEVQSILLERAGKKEQLQQVLEQSMKKNQVTPRMLEMLKKNYLAQNKPESGYQAYLLTLKDVKLDSALENKVKESMIKKSVPEFKVRNNKGKIVKLSDLKGKVVVLDFWASWCAPCKAAFPGMKMAVDKYKSDKDVVFLFVDTQEKIKDYEAYVTKYLKDHNFDFEVLFDADAAVSKSFGVGPIPHKMVIDKNGILRFSAVGYMGSPSELVDEISMMVELARKQ